MRAFPALRIAADVAGANPLDERHRRRARFTDGVVERVGPEVVPRAVAGDAVGSRSEDPAGATAAADGHVDAADGLDAELVRRTSMYSGSCRRSRSRMSVAEDAAPDL